MFLLFTGSSYAFTVNAQGTSGAAIPVTTTAKKVLACSASRSSLMLYNGGSTTIYCAPGPAYPTCGVPTNEPTTGGAYGQPIPAGGAFPFNFPGTQDSLSSEWDCIAASSTDNVWATELP